ncbi:MAG: DMT family transporter [Planctomycetota bacterium]
MKKQTKACAYALGAVVLWSTVASAFKISLRYLGVVPLLFYASIVSTVVLFCSLVLRGKLGLLRMLRKRDYVRAAFLGLLNPFLYYLVLFKAYSMLPAQEALTLNFVWPIMLVLLSIPLLKQEIGLASILAVVVSFAGVFVIATRGDILGFRFTNVTGVLLAVGSSVIWALFWIYNVRDGGDEGLRLFLDFAFGTGFILLFVLVRPGGEISAPHLRGLLGAAYIGLFEMGLTFLLWMKALQLSETTARVANLIYLVPFLSIIVIHFAVGERIFLSTIIGLVLIVAGIYLQKSAAS